MSPGCWPTSTVLLCLLKYMTLHVSTREPAHAPASLSTQGFPRLCPGDLAGCVPPVRRQLSVPSRSQGAQGHRQEHNTTSTKQKPARDQHKRGRAPPRSELNCLRCRPSGAREEEGTGERKERGSPIGLSRKQEYTPSLRALTVLTGNHV